MKIITEENLPQLMTRNFSRINDWIKVYETLYSKLMEQSKEHIYDSMLSNFNPIFTYELIKRKTKVEDFSKVFKHILGENSNQNLESMYNRFFHSDSEVGLLTYIKNDRFVNKFSCWDNMGFIFQNLEMIEGQPHRVLEKSTFPYLKEMLSHVDESNVLSLYGGSFNRFIFCFISHLPSLKPILEIVELNSAYKVEKEGYNRNFVNMLLNDISSNSYEVSDEKNINNFNFLSENIRDFESIYKNALINEKDNSNTTKKETKIHLNVLRFLLSSGVDTCEIINNKYLEKYSKLQPDNIDYIQPSSSSKQEYYRKKPYLDLIEEISSSLHVGLEKKKAVFDFKIDLKAPIEKNYVMFKYLEYGIKMGQEIILNSEQVDYISQKILGKETINAASKSAINSHKLSLYDSLSDIGINFYLIYKYVQYQNLNNDLSKKSSKNLPRKI